MREEFEETFKDGEIAQIKKPQTLDELRFQIAKSGGKLTIKKKLVN
jgi:hypothetical protein